MTSDSVHVLQADLHGCELSVLASKVQRHVGKQGIVVQVSLCGTSVSDEVHAASGI